MVKCDVVWLVKFPSRRESPEDGGVGNDRDELSVSGGGGDICSLFNDVRHDLNMA